MPAHRIQLAIIVGSVREGRFAPVVCGWLSSRGDCSRVLHGGGRPGLRDHVRHAAWRHLALRAVEPAALRRAGRLLQLW